MEGKDRGCFSQFDSSMWDCLALWPAGQDVKGVTSMGYYSYRNDALKQTIPSDARQYIDHMEDREV